MAKHKKRPLPRKKPARRPTAATTKPRTRVPPRAPPTIPFRRDDRILLVGEGDFSFARSLVEAHGCGAVTATSADGREAVGDKYGAAGRGHVAFLEGAGQRVVHGVDATRLARGPAAVRAAAPFDVVAFNFPHVGGRSTHLDRQVRANQLLLVGFFAAARPLLAAAGVIVVTLFDREPYTRWNIRDLARHSGLHVLRSFEFVAAAYPGYRHARTLGHIDGGGGWKGEDRAARSYVFQHEGRPAEAETARVTRGAKRTRGTGEGDDDDDDDEEGEEEEVENE